jgi:hypothetical protein
VEADSNGSDEELVAAGSTTKKAKPRKRKKQHLTDDEDSDEDVPSRLHPDDPDNFVKLCTALRILLARELDDADVEVADERIREYCTELIEVCHMANLFDLYWCNPMQLYGPDVIRPNHHYVWQQHILQSASVTMVLCMDFGPFADI